MHYYLYEIRNNINGKIYIGVHKTKVLDDGYMGSGLVITRAIEKHGVENFTKTILEYFESQKEMFEREKEIVNEEFLSREDTYNLRRGGNGGFDYINSNQINLYGKNGQMGFGGQNLQLGRDRIRTLEEFAKISSTLKEKYKNGYINPFAGKTHSEESRIKIGKINSIFQSGEGNSQFGTTWVHHELFGARRVPYKLIEEYIFQGWVKSKKTKLARGPRKVKIIPENEIAKLTNWYEIYKDYGFEEFCNITGYDKSKQNLVQIFKKRVISFVPQNGKKRGKSFEV